MSGSKKAKAGVVEDVAIGGIAKVDLLPQEVRDQAAARRVRGRAYVGVLGVIIVVALCFAFSLYSNVASTAQLVAARSHGDDLLLAQQDYVEVRTVQQQIAAASDAQRVGAWTEIDWADYLAKVSASRPAGVVIAGVTIDGASPLLAYTQATAPLQGPRIATLDFKAFSSDLPTVKAWLDNLAKLPGFVDAVPGSVVWTPELNAYAVAITMHVGDGAFSNRFTPQVEATTDDAASDGETADADGSTTDTAAAGGE